ncbi:FecR family protein [Sunxiuqinia dokdonensis]|nr:FecR domain-containing protein [Sunxiuqinia dokdonensis]
MKKIEYNEIWELVVGKVNNSLDAEGEAAFERIKETDEAKKALLQAKQIHRKSSNSFLIRRINKEKNWKYIHSQISHSVRARKLIIHYSRYAAIFLIALLIGIMAPKLFNYSSQEVAYNSIELEWGQMSKMTLSDSSQVWLNAGTTLKYPTTFDTQKRTVILDGEAQFKVAHNSKVPFEVKTKSGIIKVHGTTFNVESYNDDPEMVVTLIEGEVAVEDTHGNYLATLNPSEQITVNKSTGKASLRQVNTEFFSSWIDGKILLEETKLSELAVILKRWYNVDIELVGEGTDDIQISGTIIKGKPLDLFLKILERMYGIEYELIINSNQKDEVIIYKN